MFRLFKLNFLVLKAAIRFRLDLPVPLINFHLNQSHSNSRNRLYQLLIFEDPRQRCFIFSSVQERDPNIADEPHFGPSLSKVPMLQKFIFSKAKKQMVSIQKRRLDFLEGQDFQVLHFPRLIIYLCQVFYRCYLSCIIYRFFKISVQLFHCKECNLVSPLTETKD